MAFSLPQLGLTALAVGASLLWFAARAVTPKAPKGVPGPYVWPVFGVFFTIFHYVKRKQVHLFFAQMSERYGPIVHMSVFMKEIVVVADAEACKQILTSPDFARQPNRDELAEGLLEGALFMISEADKWKRHRTLLQPAFNPTNLRYTAVATTAVMDVVAAELRSRSLESEAMGVEINVLDYTSAIALDVFGKVAFSKDFDTVKDLQSFTRGKDREMLERLVDIISQRFEVPIRFWPLAGLASTSPQVVETREYTHNLVKGFIRERREAMARGERLGLGKWDMDLLDRLLQDSMNASATDDKLSETEIVGETLGLFLAGQQTTASAMSHIILSLCHNPKAMALLVQEIDTVYAKINGEITTDNLHLFQYLDWCVKESLRLYEVIGLVSRYSTTEVQVLGHTFPKGAMFLAHGHAMARDPRYFPNPTEYIPERWATPPVVGSYIPFGDGPTVCIGQKLTNIEMRVAMIHLFRQFSVKLVEGQDIEFVMDLSVSIKNGYKVLVTARK